MTLDGRPASFQVAGTKLEIVPIVLGNGHVRLECRIELFPTVTEGDRLVVASKAPSFQLDAATELEIGKMCLLSHSRGGPAAHGKPQEIETLVIAKVERLK